MIINYFIIIQGAEASGCPLLVDDSIIADPPAAKRLYLLLLSLVRLM